ncbi:GntR family transcriptional regulator [Clostridium psychrophilum]|uniref:GntR family transcriptional regulator n=1 Tax=Clostridium psychrophilum TaxID=132926 RepID=UPI001C0AA366|nr:UTRA domain-containing protein [Clostridium psychrophilum]MBU3183141.1 UTRA domain-containing protein [Clostridium psychrophilum]
MEKDVCFVRNIDNILSISDEKLSHKLLIKYQVLEKSVEESNQLISKALGIPIASKVFCFRKVKIVKNEPKCIEKLYIDYNKVPSIEKFDLGEESFHSILKREYDIETNQSEEEILVVDANEIEKKILNLKENSEILLIKKITYIKKHEPLEYCEVSSLTNFYMFRSVVDIK